MDLDFNISSKGRIYCKSHSKISLLGEKPPVVNDYASARENMTYLKTLVSLNTCKSCDHYLDVRKNLDEYCLGNMVPLFELFDFFFSF
ncbi:MAG: hypothetical protein ACFFBE_16275 [Promethearchaeota archaeon]